MMRIIEVFRSTFPRPDQSAGEGKASGRVKLKKLFKFWLMPAFGILLFLLLISRISFPEFISVLSKVDVRYFIAALIIGWTSTIFRTIRYAFFFPAPGRWINLYGAFAFLRLIYYALPFNSGELVYLGVLKKYGFSPSIAETAPAWIFLRVTDVVALVLWAIIGLIVIPGGGPLFEAIYSFRLILILISAALIIFILTLPLWMSRISFKFSNSWLSERLNAVKTGLNRTIGFYTFVRTLFFALLIWAGVISLPVLSQFAFNTPLHFSDCFMASVITLCVTLLPINPPFGLGTGDAAWVGILVIGGVSTTLAISLAISIRIVSMLLILFEGLFGYAIVIWYEKKALKKGQEP